MEKLYVQTKNGFPINVDIQNAIDGFEYFGYEPIGYSIEDILSHKMDNLAKTHPFVGSIDAMTALFRNLNKSPKPIDFPDSIIKSGLINREIKIMKLNDLFNLVNLEHKPIFVKPVETKLFDGILLSKDEHLNYLNSFDNCDVIVSDYIDIVSEHRIYVHKNKIVYSCNYNGDFKINPDFSYVNKLIENYEDQPISYTIDIAILKDGTMTVIEFNDFWAIGGYGLFCVNYATMLKDRYFEIIK